MQQFKTIIIAILGLALALQGLNIGAMGFGVTVFKDIDSLQPGVSPTQVQKHTGDIAYVLFGSAASVLIYVILLIFRFLNKASSEVEWILFLAVVVFQFGVAVVYGVLLRNNSVTLDLLEVQYNAAMALGVQMPLLTAYGKLFTFRKLCMAACILGFIFNFLGTAFVFSKYTQDSKSGSQAVGGMEIKKQTSISEMR